MKLVFSSHETQPVMLELLNTLKKCHNTYRCWSFWHWLTCSDTVLSATAFLLTETACWNVPKNAVTKVITDHYVSIIVSAFPTGFKMDVSRWCEIQEKLLYCSFGYFQVEVFGKLQVWLHVANGRGSGGTRLAGTSVSRKGCAQITSF